MNLYNAEPEDYMKKKFLGFMFGLFLLTGIGYCEENVESMLKATTMPTDEEIMQTIDKFNFTKEQKEYLFKETKRRLIEMYENQNFAPVLEGDRTVVDEYKKSTEEQAASKKKYTQHDSLTRKK